MALYILAVRRLDVRRLCRLYTFAGCAVTVAAEFVFLAVVADDPLLTLRALLWLLSFPGNHRQYRDDPVWGSNAPWFYFERMFLDGRDMWLLPFLACAGAAVLASRRWNTASSVRGNQTAAATAPNADRFVLFWATTLLAVFSFFVFSVDPLRFIPKRENYASIFLAPLALLAGVALTRTVPLARGAAVLVLAAGSVGLAGIEQQSHRQKCSRLVQAVEFARAHPDATVLVSMQTHNATTSPRCTN